MTNEAKRTLAIVNKLAEGQKLVLPDGTSIGMDGEMNIGYISQLEDGTDVFLDILTISLSELNNILNIFNIDIQYDFKWHH